MPFLVATMMQLQDDKKNLLARLAAAGAVIQTIESPIPYPLPGARIGLGNITTLAALGGVSGRKGLNFYDCLVMVVSRVLTSSFLVGNFLSPGFVISVIAAPFSFVAMYIAGRLRVFSIIGVSIAGAVTHNLSQLFVVYMFFARRGELSLFSGALPTLLVVAGVVSGSITGFIVSKLPAPVGDKGGDEEFLRHTPQTVTDDCPSDRNHSVYGWWHLMTAFSLILVVVLVRDMKVLFVSDLLLGVIFLTLRLGFSLKKSVKEYSRFVPFGIAMFVLPLMTVGRMTSVGLAPFLRVFGIFQISAILFFKDKNLSPSYTQMLPSLSSASVAFRFFPLNFVARVWDVTNLALAIAPSMREDLLTTNRKESGSGDSSDSPNEGFYRRVVRMISF